jgi:hypothetical protein
MHMAHDFSALLELEVPGVRIDLLRMGGVRAPDRGLLLEVLAVAVLNAVQRLLAILARQLLLEGERPIGLGVNAGAGGQLCTRAELRFGHIQLPDADDRIRG